MPGKHPVSRTGARAIAAVTFLLVLVPVFLILPSGARTDIQHIQAGDMIFIYEQNLDITGLRTGANPVTALRKYRNDDPTLGVLREVPVPDDTSFSPDPDIFGGQLGIYYAYNPTSGVMNSVYVSTPSVSVDAVLANPNHVYSLAGLTIPQGTRIAFKISSPDVGTSYHAGSLYPATVDLVLTTPGGGEVSSIQGMDFTAMNLTGAFFYTDDAGRPGAITLDGLEQGTYTVQARWRDPSSFVDRAPDSNLVSFIVGKSTAFQTTPTPAATPVITTAATTVPTQAAVTTLPVTTLAATPSPAATPSTPPPTQPATTPPAGTAQPSPTPAPMGTWIAILSPAIALLLLKARGRP